MLLPQAAVGARYGQQARHTGRSGPSRLASTEGTDRPAGVVGWTSQGGRGGRTRNGREGGGGACVEARGGSGKGASSRARGSS